MGRLAIVLFLIFLVLKLTHVVAWSWVWVSSPLWILAGVILVTITLILLGIDVFKDR